MENVQYMYLTASTSEYHITPEIRANVEETLRDKLRQLTVLNRIGFYDADEDTFEEYDVETVELSVDHEVVGDMMDKVCVEYSLQFDLVPKTHPWPHDWEQFEGAPYPTCADCGVKHPNS